MHYLTNKILLLSIGLVLFSISFALNAYLKNIILFQLILAFLTFSIFLYEKKKEDFSLINYSLIVFFIIDYLLSFTAGYYLLNCRKDIIQLMDNSSIFQNEFIIIIQIISLSIMLYFQNRLSLLVNKSAEINARFKLDTLPIASMAIDADLNSGLINLEEANIKRNKLRIVSCFLDNMDSFGKLINFKISVNILFCCFYLLLGTFIGIYVNNEPIVKALNISFGSSLIFTLYFIITFGFMSYINRVSINNELKLIPDININYENEDEDYTHDKMRMLGYDILKNYVLKQNDYFTKSDILRDCPSLEDLSLYSLLRELKREGIIIEIMYRKKED
jgi:type III secretory pathway component EscV